MPGYLRCLRRPAALFVAVLPVFRVLMIGVHDRTESLPVASVMHGSLSATAPVMLAPVVTGAPLSVYVAFGLPVLDGRG